MCNVLKYVMDSNYSEICVDICMCVCMYVCMYVGR